MISSRIPFLYASGHGLRRVLASSMCDGSIVTVLVRGFGSGDPERCEGSPYTYTAKTYLCLGLCALLRSVVTTRAGFFGSRVLLCLRPLFATGACACESLQGAGAPCCSFGRSGMVQRTWLAGGWDGCIPIIAEGFHRFITLLPTQNWGSACSTAGLVLVTE